MKTKDRNFENWHQGFHSMYISQVKCFKLRICSFYENSIDKEYNSCANLIRVTGTWKTIVEISLILVQYEHVTWVYENTWF